MRTTKPARSTAALAIAAVLASGVASSAGCRRDPGAGAPAPPAPAPEIPRAGADVVPAPSVSTTPSAPSTRPEPSAPSAPRLSAPGSTKGSIACGAIRCAARRESCVGDQVLRCAANGELPDDVDVYACDDASDCARGQACCFTFDSARSRTACTLRSGPSSECRAEVCAAGGAACPAGRICRDGVCRAREEGASDCGAPRCTKERPYCLWSGNGARCGSAAEAQALVRDGASSALACTRPSDCGAGAQCCTTALWDGSVCLTNCDTANNGVICATDADCKQSGSPATRCRALDPAENRALPPFLRVCG